MVLTGFYLRFSILVDTMVLQGYAILFEIMEVLGKKWTVPLLIFLLLYDKTTFSILKKKLGLTSRALVKKLKLLEAMGFVDKIIIEHPRKAYYTLNDRGKKLAEIIVRLRNSIPH